MFWPVLETLVVLGIFSLGVMFGAWIVESENKRRQKAIPLLPLVESQDPLGNSPGRP